MAEAIIQHKPYLRENTCYVCGAANAHGLRIESRWEGEEAVCTWRGEPYHNAGRANVMNGGILASLIDCHAMCAAMDAFYTRDMERIGPEAPAPYLGTVALNINYLAPTALDVPIELRARITELTEKKAIVTCKVLSAGKETVRAEVIGVRVPASLKHH